MTHRLSYLMGATTISDRELETIPVEIVDQTSTGSRMLKITNEVLPQYKTEFEMMSSIFILTMVIIAVLTLST